ncbi:MAG: HEPN domain-containing protein [Cyanobacteria bacterium J06636_16]
MAKAQRSLDAANQLMQQSFYDFAISRAYYAMFYVAEALLDKEGFSFSSHAAVISAFGQSLARPGKVPVEFHRYLIDAQTQRPRADGVHCSALALAMPGGLYGWRCWGEAFGV